MMRVMSLHRLPLPAWFLSSVGDSIGEVKRSEKGRKVVYAAELTPEAAGQIGGGGTGRRPGGGGFGGGNPPETEGMVRFEITSSGELAAIEIDTTMKMSFGERSMERRGKTTFRFQNVDDVKLEIPEEVRSQLSS